MSIEKTSPIKVGCKDVRYSTKEWSRSEPCLKQEEF